MPLEPDLDPTDAQRTVEYSIGAVGRRRFLRAVSAICAQEQGVSWDWDLVGIPGLRNVEITFRGPGDALARVRMEIDGWLGVERAYWSSGGSNGAF